MASGDGEPSIDARVREAQLEAMREEMAKRRPARPEEDRDRRGGKAGLRGAMLLVVLALILGGLYTLNVSSRELKLRDDSGASPRRRW